MEPFIHAHARHTDWRAALASAAQQLDAQRNGLGGPATLGWLYLTDPYAADAEQILAALRQRWPGVAWVGAVGIGVCATGIEYFDEPGLALMLAAIPPSDFRVFSGARPLRGFAAHAAQVHADPATPDLGELISEMSDRTDAGYLFGGLASGRMRTPHIADGVFDGALSGVAFSANVGLVSRVTQGCQPVGPVRSITAAERNVVITLDGEPALDCLLRDLQVPVDDPARSLPVLRQTLVGLTAGHTDVLPRAGQFGADTVVRHLIGIDPQRRAIAIGDLATVGTLLAFCQRNTAAARRDLMRICAEVREELEPQDLTMEEAQLLRGGARQPPSAQRAGGRIAGAVYVSCSGRGGPHFGAPSAELAIVRHALGDVPLVGFFAAGEIARRHLYGYTGVLTAFATD
jgi:small ligand-binding sensory domain FIST